MPYGWKQMLCRHILRSSIKRPINNLEKLRSNNAQGAPVEKKAGKGFFIIYTRCGIFVHKWVFGSRVESKVAVFFVISYIRRMGWLG